MSYLNKTRKQNSFQRNQKIQHWDRNCSEDDRKEPKQHDEYAIGTYLEANTGSEPVGDAPMESIPVLLLCTWALIRG